MSYDPRRSKPIIHSRESSSDSRASTSSRSSAEARYPSSRTDMANRGYYETRTVDNRDRTEYLRVPDNERHYITATISPNGRAKVFDHQKGTYEPEAPRSSDARDEDFKRSQQRDRERERRYRDQQRRSGYKVSVHKMK